MFFDAPKKAVEKSKSALVGFKQFVARGNVVDLAVGVVIGAGFSGLITALVRDFITPLLAIFINSRDFANMGFTFHGSRFLVGDFINSLISFILIALVVYFFVVLPMNALMSALRDAPPPDPSTKRCPECCSEIAKEAHRCAFCAQPVV